MLYLRLFSNGWVFYTKIKKRTKPKSFWDMFLPPIRNSMSEVCLFSVFIYTSYFFVITDFSYV